MAVGKEIRIKINSIKNTRKITRAMEMVSASKMRKAQARMHAARPYAQKIRNVIAHLAHAHPEYKHSFMQERTGKGVGLIVISTDRGLCGGLNTNMFRSVVSEMKGWHDDGNKIELCTIGSKAAGFFSRMGGKVVAQASQLGDAPKIADLIGTVKAMLDAYEEGRISRLYMAYNVFVNNMTQRGSVEQLLPIVPSDEKELQHHWDYLYEPEAKDVLTQLLSRYIESLVYQAVVENLACEQAARMVAMKAASDNAGTIINELQLIYNKARQAAITQEIAEIVGGAAAV
jgi:F-type H+-transporting ATPase subunit gamma